MNEILLIFMNFCPRIGDEDIVVVDSFILLPLEVTIDPIVLLHLP